MRVEVIRGNHDHDLTRAALRLVVSPGRPGNDAGGRQGFRVYARMILTYAIGAVIGAITTRRIGTRAAWLPAAFVGATLLLLFREPE